MGNSNSAAPATPVLDLVAIDGERVGPGLAGRRDAETYVCSACGYGVRRARPPHDCPMCHGSEWQVGRTRRKRPHRDERSSASTAEAALITLAKRGANRLIHEFASPSSGDDPVFGFLCECVDPDCHKVLWFTAEAFSRACADPDWHALAPRHEIAVSASPERS